MAEFDARQTTSEASNSRSQISSEKTLQQRRIDGENELNALKLNGLNEYARKSEALEKELQKISIQDAKNLNWLKQDLEEKYADLARKNNLSNAQVQKRLTQELYLATREYNLKAAKEAVQDRLKFSKLEYQQKEKERKDNYKKQKSEEKKNLKDRLKD